MKGEPAGWYGKIASLGDFAQRRLPPAWIARCDAWLSTALPGARAALGPRWLDIYLTAPILRFAWTPGIVDGRWWVGILMASCDNVGRYFPLIIARALSEAPTDETALDRLADWYEHVAQIALGTLDDKHGSLAALEAALAAMPATRPAAVEARPETAPPIPSAEADHRIVLAGLNDRSLWWVGRAARPRPHRRRRRTARRRAPGQAARGVRGDRGRRAAPLTDAPTTATRQRFTGIGCVTSSSSTTHTAIPLKLS